MKFSLRILYYLVLFVNYFFSLNPNVTHPSGEGYPSIQLTGVDASTGNVISTHAIQIDANLLQRILQAQTQAQA